MVKSLSFKSCFKFVHEPFKLMPKTLANGGLLLFTDVILLRYSRKVEENELIQKSENIVITAVP